MSGIEISREMTPKRNQAYRVWNPKAGARRRALRSEEVRAIAACRRSGSTMSAIREKRRRVEGLGTHEMKARERERERR